MLRNKTMMPMFRLPFLCFSSLLDFGRIVFVIMKIFLLMHLFSNAFSHHIKILHTHIVHKILISNIIMKKHCH